MRVACIDIGTNTTRLLVAEPDGAGGLRAVVEARTFARIPLSARHGGLPEATVAAIAEAGRRYVEMLGQAGVQRSRAVATAALRTAHGGAEAAAQIAAAIGMAVEILPADEEARLAFAGATQGRAGVEPVAVVDIGGGSTEVAVGVPGGSPWWWTSRAVGSGVLADAHLHGDPPPADAFEAVARAAREALAGLGAPPCTAVLAAGGSATTLGRIVGPVLDGPALDRALALLAATPSCDFPEIEPERVRVLPAGLALLRAAGEELGHPPRLAGGGLREGVALALLGTVDHGE